MPLYRRNALTDGQLFALNEVAGVLDTAALAHMRRQLAGRRPAASPTPGWQSTPSAASAASRAS